MSGEFLEKLRAIKSMEPDGKEEWWGPKNTLIEMSFLARLSEEILAVVERARKTSDGPTANWGELRRVLNALDEKARKL